MTEPSPLNLLRLERRLLERTTRSSLYISIANHIAQLAGTAAETVSPEL